MLSSFLKYLSLINCVLIVKSSVIIDTRVNQGTNALNTNFFESSQTLDAHELIANETIMGAKLKEIDEGLIKPHLFKPSQSFFDVADKINESDLFKLLRKMPKGGVLHAHSTAMCSADFLLKLTYWDDLWTCTNHTNNNFQLSRFKFSLDEPKPSVDCSWELLSVLRKGFGAPFVDSYISEKFSMNVEKNFEDGNAAWNRFQGIFRFVSGLLRYEPVFKAYYKNALQEFSDDGIQYLEFRTSLPRLYDLNGNYFSQMHTARVYQDVLQEFLGTNPSFIGSKFIYATSRAVNSSTVANYIEFAKQLKAEFPDFFAGFDLVGQEDKGAPLKNFYAQLQNVSGEINFYFHAGETNWFGTEIDENLLTAVDLRSKRIAHGFALSKYPEILQKLKERNIAIEVCPISNQVFQLVQDFRNHPGSHFFANNNSVVISSDDPSFWGATPLSHDFYIAFLGIASAHSDLRLLKQLIANSFVYSAMNITEKYKAYPKWLAKWSEYIIQINNCRDQFNATKQNCLL